MTKKKYTQVYIDLALDKIKNNEMSFPHAEYEYGIPISILCNNKNGKSFSHKVEKKNGFFI